MKKIFFTLFSLAILCPLCFAGPAPVPAWLKNIEKEFPKDQYIRAVGEGSSEKAAKTAALAEIALLFDTKVEIVTEAVKNFSAVMTDGNETVSKSQSLSQVTKVSSSAEFFCLDFTEPWYDKKSDKYSILAYINKKDAVGVYKSRIAALSESVGTLGSSAKKEREPFLAALYLQKAKALSTLAERYIKAETVIVPGDSAVYEETLKSFSRLDGELAARKKELTFSISMNQTDKKFAPISSTIASIIEKRGFACSQSGANYIVKIDISCSEEEYEAGPFVRASVDVSVVNKAGVGVYSYSKTHPRAGSKTMDLAYTRAVSKIKQDLEENFLAEF